MLKIAKTYLRPYIPAVLIVLLFQIGQVACTLYLPNMNAHIIDNGVTKGDIPYIWREGTFMLLLSVGQIILAVTATYFGAKAAFSVGRDIRRDLYSKVQGFSTREVSHFGAPTLITRTTNDITQVQSIMMFMMTLIATAPIMFIGGIIMSLEQDVALSGVIGATFPVIVIVAAIFVKKMTPYFRKFQKKIDRMNEILREQITGVRPIRAFVREKTEHKRFYKANKDIYDLSISTGRLMTLLFPIFMFIVNVSILAIMWFGGIRVSNGDMEIGAITAFITYMMYIMMAVLMSSMVFVMLPRAQVSAKRINDVLETESTVIESVNPVHLEAPKGVIEFKGVEFRYSGAAESVLSNVSFTAQPGKTTAIIGSTGCGKSTLLRLIPRLYDATEGEVLFDGVNVKDMSLDDLNDYIGVIPQKSFLFSGTVADNLRFGKPDATEEEMWEALEIAQSAEFIREEEGQLEAKVAQGGSNFSGGQRQRLAIARAVIKKPKVFQFDDSFSALDYATDHNLRQALKTITQESTVLIVAQRVSTIRRADLILVLDEGSIVGSGTHEELLLNCPTYKEIVDSQLSAEEALK